MLTSMQIPKNPIPVALGFLSRAHPGSPGAAHAAPAREPSAKGVRGPDATGLAAANSLDEAVRALRADGRLPRRGSLIDLSA
jgi:hypothetical protein